MSSVNKKQDVDIVNLALTFIDPTERICDQVRAFKAGYKSAESNSFTLDDMHECWIAAIRKTTDPAIAVGFTDFIKLLNTEK